MRIYKSLPIGYSLIFLSTILFGSYGIWSRLMGETFEPFYQAWVRSIIIILIMLPFMLAAKSFKKIERKDRPHVGLFILFCIFTQVPLYYAFNHAPIGTVQLIFYSVFVITAYIVSKIYLNEAITKIKILSMGLAFAGLVIIFGVSVLTFAPLGLALAALNGVASGGEVSSSKKVSDKYSPALLIFWGWIFTFLTHLPISLIAGEQQVTPAFNKPWLWLMVYSVVNTAAFWLVVVGFKFVDASIGSLIGLMEVVFAITFAAIVFHEKLSLAVFVGGALILIAAMLPDLLNIIRGRPTKTAIEPVREL